MYDLQNLEPQEPGQEIDSDTRLLLRARSPDLVTQDPRSWLGCGLENRSLSACPLLEDNIHFCVGWHKYSCHQVPTSKSTRGSSRPPFHWLTPDDSRGTSSSRFRISLFFGKKTFYDSFVPRRKTPLGSNALEPSPRVLTLPFYCFVNHTWLIFKTCVFSSSTPLIALRQDTDY